MFENISNSTFIYLGWLIVGALAFVAYRRYRHKPIWEPLESAPRPDLASTGVGLTPHRPSSERVHLRRHKAHVKPAETPVEHHRVTFEQRLVGRSVRGPRVIVILLVALVVAVAAVVIDLSPLDPFGPRLGWSPGVVLMAALLVRVLITRDESDRR